MDRYVLDTNILLVSVSRKSPLNWIIQRFEAGAYELCVTTEILLEYAEVLGQHMGPEVRDAALEILENSPYLVRVKPVYRFNLLLDPDDNKFVDCAITAAARVIVSHDNDFAILRRIAFPKVIVVDTEGFRRLLFPPQ